MKAFSMKTKLFRNAFLILIFTCPILCFADDFESVGDYLSDYASSQYKNGLFADAVHELRKCLQADPRNKKCRAKLEEILTGPFKLASSDVVCINETVFFDASGSYARLLQKPQFLWDFGDGTYFRGAKANKSYKKAGTYFVKLIMQDDVGGAFSVFEKKFKIKVYGQSEVDAGPDIRVCCNSREDYEVNFIANRDGLQGKDATYTWNFGDGFTGKGRQVRHLYRKPGFYIAQVKAKDSCGPNCPPAEDFLRVYLKNPVKANAGADKTGYVGEELLFDASKSNANDNASFIWDFGDGSEKSFGALARHIYKKGGEYSVKLIVDDKKDTECSVSENVIKALIKSGPTADLAKVSASCIGKEIEFDASDSSHPDGKPLYFLWDFGDGSTAKGQPRVKHTYKEGGEYVVRVTVDDLSKSPVSKSSAQAGIRVNIPPIAVIESEDSFCVTQPVKLSGLKSSDPDNDKLSYSWDFGDGTTAAEAQVKHTYNSPGKYTVKLQVSDGSECGLDVAERFITIVPNASLKIIQGEVKKCFEPGKEYNAEFEFDKFAQTNLTDFNCLWDFGDGTTGDGKNVRHYYGKSGVYQITIKIDSGGGLPCSSASGKFKLRLNAPPKSVIAAKKTCCANALSEFDASGSLDQDGDKLTYAWDFGDGQTATGIKTTHTYKKGGQYTVKLLVKDDSGVACDFDESTLKINVNEKPVAAFEVKQ